MTGNVTYHWFWAEWFWFPAKNGYGWKTLHNEPGSDIYYPQLEDIHWALVLALVLIIARFFVDKIIVVPLATKLGITNKPKPVIVPNAQLEDAYRKRKTHDQNTIEVIKKQTDFTQRQIEVWFRKRKAQDAPTPMQKFKECSYNLVFYQTMFIYGMYVLWQKPYFWKTFLCWRDWPSQHVSDGVYWYYMIELAFYWSLVFTYFSDHQRKDFIEMTVHHVATITLMYFSWVMNFVRVGTLVLVVHDAADSWLCLAKLSIYLKKKTATDAFFGMFVLVWTVTRLFVYPLVILNCTTFEPFYEAIDETFGSHAFFNFFLYLLQILHLMWTYSIYSVIYRKLLRGNVEDIRSDSEDSDDARAYDDDEEEDDKKITDNGTVSDNQTTNGYAIHDGSGDVKTSDIQKRHKENGTSAMEVTAEIVNGDVQKRNKENGTNSGFKLNVDGDTIANGNERSVSASKIPKIRKTQ